MRGFAGVVVLRNNFVLLVSEPDYFTAEPRWTFPSGGIDEGEGPAAAAARELADESGCVIDSRVLELVAVADVERDGATLSRSWNYTATTTETALEPRDDPDEIVTEARWFEHAEAVKLLAQASPAPKVEPALRFLTSGDRNLHWTFDLVDDSTSVPSFRVGPSGHGAARTIGTVAVLPVAGSLRVTSGWLSGRP